MVDSRIVPLNPVASGGHSTVRHAPDELDVWGLVFGTKLDTCLSGIVQKLVVANPKRSVPSFVVFPTVHRVSSCVPLYYGIKKPPLGRVSLQTVVKKSSLSIVYTEQFDWITCCHSVDNLWTVTLLCYRSCHINAVDIVASVRIKAREGSGLDC